MPVLPELDPGAVDRVPGAGQGVGGRRRARHAGGARARANCRPRSSRPAREAQAAFGDGTVFCEPLLTGARHVEVQVLGRHPRHGLGAGRTRLLGPAPLPEGDRGDPVPGRRPELRERLQRGRATRSPRRSATSARARSSSWSPATASSTSWSSTPGCRSSTRSPSACTASTWSRCSSRRRGRAAAAGRRRPRRATRSRPGCTRRTRRRLPPGRRRGARAARPGRGRAVRAAAGRRRAGLRLDSGCRGRQRGQPALRRDAGQGDRLGARPAERPRGCWPAPWPGPDPRPGDQPDLLVRVLRDPDFLDGGRRHVAAGPLRPTPRWSPASRPAASRRRRRRWPVLPRTGPRRGSPPGCPAAGATWSPSRSAPRSTARAAGSRSPTCGGANTSPWSPRRAAPTRPRRPRARRPADGRA